MNLEFLTPAATEAGGATGVAKSPIEACARAAGARYEARDGWNVAVGFGAAPEQEAAAAAQTAGWADVSHLGKLEIQGPADSLERIASACDAAVDLGWAARAGDAWWCPMTRTRLLVIGAGAALRERLNDAVAAADGATLVDVTTNFAAITLAGPLSREVFARFCALDLRPARTPARALRPGSIGRQPGILICEAEDRYLFLFGWAIGEYMWSTVTDAGGHLGGRPIGVDALPALPALSTIAAEVKAGA
jgi:glycine cleavage system aminomethyltransferase T